MSEDADRAMAEAAEIVLAERQWPITVTLKHPVSFGSETVTSLEFRRGKMGDLKGMGTDDLERVDKVMLVASRMCGKPVAVLDQLSDEDGVEVYEIALGFFARCLAIGRKR